MVNQFPRVLILTFPILLGRKTNLVNQQVDRLFVGLATFHNLAYHSPQDYHLSSVQLIFWDLSNNSAGPEFD